MDDEQWRPVPGWEGRYEASDLGRVRSLWSRHGPRPRPLLLRQTPTDRNRPQVSLYPLGKRVFVSKIIAWTWLPPQPPGTEVCHNDGDHTNNRATNLRWDTHSANMLDAVRQGTHVHTRRDRCPKGHLLTGRKRNKRSPTGWTRYCKDCQHVYDVAKWANRGG